MRELNVRRELLRAIILAALVGAAGGTVITLIGISIIKLSPALLIILPSPFQWRLLRRRFHVL